VLLINADLWRRQFPDKDFLFEIDNWDPMGVNYIWPLIYILTPDLKVIRKGDSIYTEYPFTTNVLAFDCNPGEVRD